MKIEVPDPIRTNATKYLFFGSIIFMNLFFWVRFCLVFIFWVSRKMSGSYTSWSTLPGITLRSKCFNWYDFYDFSDFYNFSDLYNLYNFYDLYNSYDFCLVSVVLTA